MDHTEFFSPQSLRLSWERYTRYEQSSIKDYIGINSFSWNIEKNLESLHKKLKSNNYKPSLPLKFDIPKSYSNDFFIWSNFL